MAHCGVYHKMGLHGALLFSFIIMSNAQINTCEDKWVMINLILMQPYGIREKLEPSCSPLLKLAVKLQDYLSHRNAT
jgi:hypothetical protein